MALLARIGYDEISLPVTVAVAAVASIGYMVSLFRRGKAEFTLMDAVILVVLMAIVTATAVPVVESLSRRAKVSALRENLHGLRTHIQRYMIEHGGEPPLVYEGELPQLTSATNARGIPGNSPQRYPYGPYLQTVPVNPLTGSFKITAVDEFPPKEPSKNGGWLYHQPTGQIAPDAEGYLDL